MSLGDEDSAVHPKTTAQPNAAKQDGSGQSVCNKQSIDMREAKVQQSIVGNQGDININYNYYNAPGRQYPDEKTKVAAIEKHQLEHLQNLPESVVLYDNTAKQNQLPEVHPRMHHYDAYGGGNSPKEDIFIPSTQQKVADRSNKKTVSFNEIFTLTSQKKFIAIVGPPGSGKTTLSKRLARLSQSNQSAKFLLRFMDLNYRECLSYKQLFIDFLCPELDEETKENAFKWMRENPDKCVFVFDGYDQATWSLENVKPPNASYDTHLPIDQLVANLCIKKFFKGSLLIFTSRPHSILKIPSDLRPDVTVHVDDLSTEDMEKLFKAFAGERAEELWKMFTARTVQLFGLCHNPMLLQFIIFTVLRQGLNQVCTITELFQSLLEQLRYSDNSRGMDITKLWEPLGKMAYEGMQHGTVVFTTDNLQGLDATVVQDIIIAFARNIGFPTQRLFDGDQLFYFTHQMLQEMFAAKFICDFMSIEEFHKIIGQVANGGSWSMVRRFMCGLLLGTKNKKEKSSIFLCLLIEELGYTLGEDTGSYFFELLIDLQECCDEVVDLCATHIPGVICLATIPISLSGAHALAQILPRVNLPVEQLDLKLCRLKPNSFKWIFEGISKRKYKVKILLLSENRLRDVGVMHLKSCFDKIERLVLNFCNISSTGCKIMSEALKKLGIPMKELDMSNNGIGDEGVRHLTNYLDKMEKLVLKRCNITSTGVKSLSIGLKKLDLHMKELDLSENLKIGDIGVMHLSSCLDKTETLVLMLCDITSTGVKMMSVGLKTLVTPLKELDLTGNKIGDEGVGHLTSCLDKMEKLRLWNCDITDTGKQTVLDSIRNLNLPISDVDFDYYYHLKKNPGHKLSSVRETRAVKPKNLSIQCSQTKEFF